MSATDPQATPTPRTKAVCGQIGKSGVDWHHSASLMAEFAERLERELHAQVDVSSALNLDLTRLRADYEQLRNSRDGLAREIAVLKENPTERDGNWIDKWGACKVCDGEIPYGHAANCDIWKLEEQLAAANVRIAALGAANTSMWSDYVKKRDRVTELEAERDEARDQRNAVGDINLKLTDQLAESREREQWLREALQKIQNGEAIGGLYGHATEIARAALAQPAPNAVVTAYEIAGAYVISHNALRCTVERGDLLKEMDRLLNLSPTSEVQIRRIESTPPTESPYTKEVDKMLDSMTDDELNTALTEAGHNEPAPTEPNPEATLPEISPPSEASPCCVCGKPITPFDSYGVGNAISHRYHWECVKKEAALVSAPTVPRAIAERLAEKLESALSSLEDGEGWPRDNEAHAVLAAYREATK